jgi:hypothetical protein
MMPSRADGTDRFRDTSARFTAGSELSDQNCANDARGHPAEADDHRPLHRVDTPIDFSKAGFRVGFNLVEPLVDLIESFVDLIEPLVDVLLEVVQPLVGPPFSCHDCHGGKHRRSTVCKDAQKQKIAAPLLRDNVI